MANLSDEMFKSTILGMIFGIPIMIGFAILAIPFIIISSITGVPIEIIIQNLIAFILAVFFVWLFSRFQIIENGIVGLAVGILVYIYFKWNPIVCVLIGLMTIGLLFFISRVKIGFWIKTILFSAIITFLLFSCLYSETGFFPLSSMVWKTAFIIIFFLENIFIRCSVAYDKGVLLSKSRESQAGSQCDLGKNQIGLAADPLGGNGTQAINPMIPEINNVVREMNAAVSNEQKTEETANYLMERVNRFSQKKSFWDGRLIDNMEEKVYSELKNFIDRDYLVLPHVAFREIFWWKDWREDQKLTDRVTKMHFDFGVYNKELQPIFFLEVQGKDHKENPEVIERDKFKAVVMEQCGMKLIALDCSEPMKDSEIRDKLIARIKEEIPDRQSCPVFCPICRRHGINSPMIIRRNKSNGTFFYGCSTYKEGRQDNCPTLNLEEVPLLYYKMPIFKDKSEQ